MTTLQDTTVPPPNPNGANLNQSQKSVTGTTAQSSGAKRKLAQDEVKFTNLNTDLKKLVGSLGGMMLTIGVGKNDPIAKADGMVILQNHEKLSDDLTSLARQYKYVYEGLNYLVQGSVWSLVIGDLIGIGIAIAVNHGIRIPVISGSDEDVKKAQQLQILQLQQQLQQLQEAA